METLYRGRPIKLGSHRREKPLKVVNLYDNFQILFYNQLPITFLVFFDIAVLTCLLGVDL
ncbi:hypothetical protein AGR7A_Lc120152 [Agrobacterium deltaense NCPPB 1641]|uniref:Uncharacterized protein n=1 Tax=Agrobacterium deltaense NCPPB 1641 TaxID=1183425 RepID=A0A1S7TWB9_9HYPH|nr:hypothetical protein AGR7A_Lc120152 [Agrobacterium deltaense NCPPB 1641]